MARPLTTAEVSAMTGISEATFRWYRHIGAGGPRSFKLGRRVMYKPEDVHLWVDTAYADGARQCDPQPAA